MWNARFRPKQDEAVENLSSIRICFKLFTENPQNGPVYAGTLSGTSLHQLISYQHFLRNFIPVSYLNIMH